MVKFTVSLPRKRSRSRSSKYVNSSGFDQLMDILNKKHQQRCDGDSEEESDSDDESSPGLFGRDKNDVYFIQDHIYFRGSVNKDNVDSLVKIIDKKNLNTAKRLRTLLGETFSGLKITKASPEPLYLHISSNGGSSHDGMIAIDAIRNSKRPIYTIVEGYAASAATLMSMVGAKRFITKNSYMLIHQLSGWSSGKFEELVDEHQNKTKLMDHIKELYQEYTKLTKEQLDEILKHDIWWRSEECLSYGLVDEIK